MNASPLQEAIAYTRRGWAVTPVRYRDKKPIHDGWQKLDIPESSLARYFSGQVNIGVRTGAPSHGLVDTDLDVPEAVLIGARLLPPTDLKHGRKGNPRSHYWYQSEGAETRKFQFIESTTREKTMLVELRADDLQTVVAPSLHTSGEAYVWESCGKPTEISPDALVTIAGRVAAGALLARHWPGEGSRDDASMALCGMLACADWSASEIDAFVVAVAEAAGDEEYATRNKGAPTVRRYHDGEEITGTPTLIELLRNGGSVVKKAREWLRLLAGASSDERLPKIITSNQQLRDPGAEATAALDEANTPPVLFRRAGTLARVSADEDGRPIIALHDRDTLKARLTNVANFFRLNAKGELVGVPPADEVTRYVLAQTDWPFPALRGVIECPILRPDGSLLKTPGYDAVTRLIYHAAPGFSLPAIPDKPTAADRAAALAFIENEVLVDFPFDDDIDEVDETKKGASRAHALALLLTPLLRAAINDLVPLALVTAPTRGTGKGLLVKVAANIALGHHANLMSAPSEEAEWTKKITSTLVDGPAMVLIDDITGVLKSSSLEALLTTEEWTDRILGASVNRTLPNSAVWMATGNNLALAGDLPRRCYRVRLDAQCIRPERRDKFKHNPLVPWTLAHRGEILAALLTIARSWYADGRPAYATTPMGNYEEWSRIVGCILAHAGVKGFLSNLDEMYDESDSEGAQWGAFFGVWHGTYTSAVTAATIAHDAGQPDHALHAVLPDALQPSRDAVNVNVRKLGQELRKKVDVRFAYGDESDEITLRHAGEDRSGSKLWHIQRIVRGAAYD